MTTAELLADEFGSNWDSLTADQQQLLVIDTESIADEDGVSHPTAVQILRRRLGYEEGVIERYASTLQIGAARRDNA